MTRDITHLGSVSGDASKNTLLCDWADGQSKSGSASGPVAQYRSQRKNQRKVNYRCREQLPCSRPRPLQYEFQPKVQVPETQQPSYTIKTDSVMCRRLHQTNGDKKRIAYSAHASLFNRPDAAAQPIRGGMAPGKAPTKTHTDVFRFSGVYR